ncbi:hypothetical protein [Waddlia chondrophila]|uniref:Uncharacterized protein n=1 Tax=Waddlia chondrophila (strain ATCC VR-1470 / WSU 86-1044) TaxID=716544 RepID=D6YRX4_WADCW|nr:hypothetical protein [Waddlia chondrophila]ADI38819.1 hypothetical protein wcw_1470 [Waddlia chondrophila WSU 86-1044]
MSLISSSLSLSSKAMIEFPSRWELDLQSPSQRAFLAAHPAIFNRLDDTVLKQIPHHPWLSVLVYALEFPETLDKKAWNMLYADLSLKETHCILCYIFEHPELIQGMDLGSADTLSIQPWGGAFHNFHQLGMDLMKKEGEFEENLVMNFSKGMARKVKKVYETETDWRDLKSTSVDFTKGKIIKVLGRTVLFQPNDSDKIFACKFLRTGESISEFCREKAMIEIFRECSRFKSRLPIPISISNPKSLPFEEFPVDVEKDQPALYVQQVEEHYYHYLHQIKDDSTWNEARKKFLFDSGLQLSLGQLPPFVELFHNEESVRKYQPLANLIPNINRGAGRLETPFLKTQYPNAGAWGARDVGDGPHLSEVVKNPTLESFDLFKLKKGKVHYLLMNGLAKLMLVDSLLLLHRLRLQERLDWKDPSLVQTVAGWLKEGQIEALCGFTQKSLDMCRAFIDQLPIDWDRQAKQIMFWVQDDEKGYPQYLDAGKLPEGLYDSKMSSVIDLKKAQNYSQGVGFLSGSDADIGCYNGPLGWIESEKSWYWISAFAVGVHICQSKDVYSINEKNLCESQKKLKLRRLSFSEEI